jgi:pimeloyl-ACP methyl ester carboxylesterase
MATLVLLPGMDGTGDLFSSVLPLLSQVVRTQVVSYPPDQPLDHAQLAEFVLEQLPQDRPFALLGESFSGPIAAAVAARSTPAALILACSFVTNPHRLLRVLRPLLPWLPRPTTLLRPLGLALMGSHATPQLRTALAQALRQVRPEVLKFRAAASLGADARASLAAVRCPVLYLRAKEDRVVPRRCLDDVLRTRPDTAVAEIDGPHFLLQTQPAASAQAIASFLARCGASDAQGVGGISTE